MVQVAAEVRAMVGHSIHPEEPLMSAGLDSRGGMELRRALGDTLHLDLPVTLLYDYQSISAIVGYVEGLVEAQSVGQGGGDGNGRKDDEQEQGASAVAGSRMSGSAVTAAKPSKLLKTLRLVSLLSAALACIYEAHTAAVATISGSVHKHVQRSTLHHMVLQWRAVTCHNGFCSANGSL